MAAVGEEVQCAFNGVSEEDRMRGRRTWRNIAEGIKKDTGPPTENELGVPSGINKITDSRVDSEHQR